MQWNFDKQYLVEQLVKLLRVVPRHLVKLDTSDRTHPVMIGLKRSGHRLLWQCTGEPLADLKGSATTIRLCTS